jgi:hypothetical protein
MIKILSWGLDFGVILKTYNDIDDFLCYRMCQKHCKLVFLSHIMKVANKIPHDVISKWCIINLHLLSSTAARSLQGQHRYWTLDLHLTCTYLIL